jgi:hypothetical protein
MATDVNSRESIRDEGQFQQTQIHGMRGISGLRPVLREIFVGFSNPMGYFCPKSRKNPHGMRGRDYTKLDLNSNTHPNQYQIKYISPGFYYTCTCIAFQCVMHAE